MNIMVKNSLKVKLPVILVLVAILGLMFTACVPSDLQDSIRATQADVKALKGNVDSLSKKVNDMGVGMQPIVDEQAPSGWERNIQEHVVRGRADFIAFSDNFDKMNKSQSGFITALTGTPAKKAADGSAIPAKPGFIQTIDTKLDQIVGVPGKAAVPEKTDPQTGKVTPGKAAVPPKSGLIDGVSSKLEMLVGKPGVPATLDKKDAKTGKVTPGKPAVPPTPGEIDNIKKDLSDIKASLAKIEKALTPAPAAPATPATP